MRKLFTGVLTLSLFLSFDALALDMKKYLTFERGGIVELQDKGFGKMGDLDKAYFEEFQALEDVPSDPIGEAEIILDRIINMGKKIWAIIEKGRPVVKIDRDVADALPKGLKRWDQLAGWSAPQSAVYRVVYKNKYGMSVVKYDFRVLYTYGGNLKGKGRYLTHITVIPANLEVAWGYTFNSQAKVPRVTNAGTSKAPLAQAEIMVNWEVKTVMKHDVRTRSFYTRGDGTFKQLD